MLHSLPHSSCYRQMLRLLVFQRRVLKLAITLAGTSGWTKRRFQDVLGEKPGEWFWSQYENKTRWESRFVNVCKACATDPESAKAILPAFDHDVNFPAYLDRDDFDFHYPRLHPDIKSALRPLLEYFYDYFEDTGYDSRIHCITNLTLTREHFLICYYRDNKHLKVCSVCDGEIQVRNTEARNEVLPLCDLDHFFPKSKYPFFSLHPANLVPTCHICNHTFKGTQDPLKAKKSIIAFETLKNTYFPYRARAIENLGGIEVQRTRLAGAPEILIADRDTTPHCRIENANRLFKLSDRWTQCLEGQQGLINRLFDRLSILINERRRYQPDLTLEDFEEVLEIEKSGYKRGLHSQHTLQIAYVDFALSNEDELAALFSFYSGEMSMKIANNQ